MLKPELYVTTALAHKDISLTVYQERKDKNVLLFSSLYPNVKILDNSKKLPDTVAYYNATEFSVDVIN